ncbi:MAG: peptidase T [Clostridia bacterium]|nr:peptidase T [Clostridia bacterium]
MDIRERFLTYVSFYTTSDEDSETSPSTMRQKALSEHIASELRALGVDNAFANDFGYVYAFLPANCETNQKPLGLIAHVDTAPAAPGENIKPRVIDYRGGDIELGNGVVTREKDFPLLKNYVGQHLIVTDGTTLLGADDKAGVAEIMSAVEYLIAHPEVKHRGVAVCFTPDEEVGRGTEHFDFDAFHAKQGYTVDGGTLGEIEYENFNAAAVKINVRGRNIHPGSAKNKMKNAVLYACDFVSCLPAAETPAHTEGYEGFYHVQEVSGDENAAVVKLIIRDHDLEKFTARKTFIRNLTDYMNTVYGADVFTADIRDSYYNMKEKILPHFSLITDAEKAFADAGVTPKIIPIRGGTDGAMLSYRGLPCPNLSTGGENFHGPHEFVSVEAMETMTKVLLNLVRLP